MLTSKNTERSIVHFEIVSILDDDVTMAEKRNTLFLKIFLKKFLDMYVVKRILYNIRCNLLVRRKFYATLLITPKNILITEK